MRVTVLAMSQGGDVYLTRDARGIVRRHHRYLPGDPLEVSPAEAERVIDNQAYVRLDDDFDTWTQAADFVEARVPKVAAEHLPISARLAKALIPELREAATDSARAMLVPAAIARLLKHEAVFRDESLRRKLLEILVNTASGESPRFGDAGKPASRMKTAQSYFELESAA